MNHISHPALVHALAKPGADILSSLTPSDCHNLHMILGICGEAGELLDAIKKSTIYRKPLDMVNVIEELGDIEFYLEGLRQSLNISRDETLHFNIEKLGKRYENMLYSDHCAQARLDKQHESGAV